MSELLPGLEALTPVVATPRDAAAVVLFRKVQRPAEGRRSAPLPTAEVFWLKREAKLTFAGGFYAFPGGKVDKADAEVAVEGASGVAATEEPHQVSRVSRRCGATAGGERRAYPSGAI